MSFATFHYCMAHFSMPNSIPISWLNILRVLQFPVLFHFFANSLISSMYFRWLVFSCDLLNVYPAVHFLSMWLSGIMAIMDSNGESVSPWNISLWIITSGKLFPLAVNSSLQVYMAFSIKFMTSCNILYILRQFIIQLCGIISYAFS